MKTSSSRGPLLLSVVLLAFLPAFTNVRLGSLQLVDILSLLVLGVCVAKVVCRGFAVRISHELSSLLRSYSLFVLVLTAMSALALRLTFTPIEGASFLKTPGVFSLSKLLQLAADICAFLWLSNTLLHDRALLIRALRAYWLAGVLSALYAILCYVALTNLNLGSLYPSLFGAYANEEGVARARGFFNEGGPFGLYLVSVIAAGFVFRHLTGRRMGRVALASLFVAFLLAASKAGLFAAAILILLSVLSVASIRQRIVYLGLSAVLLTCAGLWFEVGTQLIEGYLYSYQNTDEVIATHGLDMNVVAGRVSALHIVPKMIEAHPLAGIGFGNYPLMRNNPEYLGNLPAISDIEDLPGIGVPAMAAEIGIPATLWLLFLLCVPYGRCRKGAAVIAAAAAFQPVAHACAVQLTFFYPWFVSACAFAAADFGTKVHERPYRRSTKL